MSQRCNKVWLNSFGSRVVMWARMDETTSPTVFDGSSFECPARLTPAPQHVEGTCAILEGLAQGALECARGLSAAGKKLLTVAKEGRLRDVRATSESFVALAEQLNQQAAQISGAAAFDCEAALSSPSFTEDILAAARQDGLALHADGLLLYCFPHVVRILPAEGAVSIGRKREYRIRPTALVRRLRAEQRKPVRFKPQQFLQLLFSAYLLAAPPDMRSALTGFVVSLSGIYQVLTLFPGTSKEYTQVDFARDMYLLDRSGMTSTKDGAVVSFPASTGTRAANVSLSVVTETGQQVRYYGISFVRSASES